MHSATITVSLPPGCLPAPRPHYSADPWLPQPQCSPSAAPTALLALSYHPLLHRPTAAPACGRHTHLAVSWLPSLLRSPPQPLWLPPLQTQPVGGYPCRAAPQLPPLHRILPRCPPRNAAPWPPHLPCSPSAATLPGSPLAAPTAAPPLATLLPRSHPCLTALLAAITASPPPRLPPLQLRPLGCNPRRVAPQLPPFRRITLSCPRVVPPPSCNHFITLGCHPCGATTPAVQPPSHSSSHPAPRLFQLLRPLSAATSAS